MKYYNEMCHHCISAWLHAQYNQCLQQFIPITYGCEQLRENTTTQYIHTQVIIIWHNTPSDRNMCLDVTLQRHETVVTS